MQASTPKVQVTLTRQGPDGGRAELVDALLLAQGGLGNAHKGLGSVGIADDITFDIADGISVGIATR
jgi:hypothetical protein